MGWKFEIHAESQVPASAQAVWVRVRDHEGTPEWVTRGLQSVTLTRPGDRLRLGVGAMRAVKFMAWPAVTEEIVGYDDEEMFFSYALRSGMPHVTEHLGTVSVHKVSDDACTLRWDIEFEFNPWHPLSWSAPVFIAGFNKVVQDGCDELARQFTASAAAQVEA